MVDIRVLAFFSPDGVAVDRSTAAKPVPDIAMQATTPPTQLVEKRAWCWREQNKLSEAFATAWCFLSDTMLLERPVVSIVVSAAVCIALASGLADIDVSAFLVCILRTFGWSYP